jgi:hypothetical protein
MRLLIVLGVLVAVVVVLQERRSRDLTASDERRRTATEIVHGDAAKAARCAAEAARTAAHLAEAGRLGVLLAREVNATGVMVMLVDETLWAPRPYRSQEAIALAGWCEVADPAGFGAVALYGARGRELLAIVRDGRVTIMP